MRKFALLLGLLVLVGAPGNAVTIDFEGTGAPVLFVDATALRSLGGVTFSGPDVNDGGAILNQAGGFGVDARSGTDFLAFNNGSQLSDGGVPRAPETLSFTTAVSFVSIWASDGNGPADVTFEAFDSANALVASDALTVQPGIWQELSVAGTDIRSVVISISGAVGIATFDDLTYVPVPEPGTALLLSMGLAGFGLRRPRP